MPHTVPNHYMFYGSLWSYKVFNLQQTYIKFCQIDVMREENSLRQKRMADFASGEYYRLMKVHSTREKSRPSERLQECENYFFCALHR